MHAKQCINMYHWVGHFYSTRLLPYLNFRHLLLGRDSFTQAYFTCECLDLFYLPSLLPHMNILRRLKKPHASCGPQSQLWEEAHGCIWSQCTQLCHKTFPKKELCLLVTGVRGQALQSFPRLDHKFSQLFGLIDWWIFEFALNYFKLLY